MMAATSDNNHDTGGQQPGLQERKKRPQSPLRCLKLHLIHQANRRKSDSGREKLPAEGTLGCTEYVLGKQALQRADSRMCGYYYHDC